MTHEFLGETEDGAIDRRSAIKRGIAAGAAAGVVWSAPKVEGLTLRPNYASAQSAANETTNFMVTAVAPGDRSSFSSNAHVCADAVDIQFRVRKDFQNNPRNISLQFNPSGPDSGTGLPSQVMISPASALPAGGLNNLTLTTNANGYTYMGQLAIDGPISVTIPYVCG